MDWLVRPGALLAINNTPCLVSQVVVLSLMVRVTLLPSRTRVTVATGDSITILLQRPSESGVILVLVCTVCPAIVMVELASRLPSFFHDDCITPSRSSFRINEKEASSSNPARLAGKPFGFSSAVELAARRNTSGNDPPPCFQSPVISVPAVFILP